MNQVIKDCDNDIKAVKGSLDTLRARFQSGALDKAVYQARETGLMRNQWDLAKARDLARAALRAERSAALPAARSSFIRRLAKQERGDGLGKDCWFAWLAAALMLLNITIDITPGQLTANMVALQGLTLVLFVTAVLVSMAAAIPRKRIRGGTYLVLALVYLIAVTACLEQTYHGLGPLGGALRSAPSWFLSAGVLLLFGNYVLVQAAAFVTLRKEEGPVRRALGWSPAIGLAAAAVAGSSCLGLYAPRPELLMPEPGLYSRAIAGYSVTFTIENRGHRPFWYGGSVEQLPRPVSLVIEKEQAPGNWRPISASHTMRHARWSGFRPPEPGHAVGRHRFVKLRYTLRPGEYRYRLNDPLGRGGDPFERLTLPAGMEMEGSWNAAQENTQDAERAPAPETITVKLRGVTDPKARSPLTYFLVTLPGGEPKEVKLRLGETIAGRWTISEYNTERASVTLSDGASFLLIRTGETLELTLSADTVEDADEDEEE